jgi:hypothetical protein
VDLYDDSGGTIQHSNNGICAYTVAANGRVLLGNGTHCQQAPILYLSAANTGFMVNTASPEIGAFGLQTGGPFTNSSVSGTFFVGTDHVPTQAGEPTVGVVTLGSGNVSGTSDTTSTISQNPAGTIADTYTVNSAGWVTLGTDANPTLLIVNANKLVKIDPSKSTDLYPMALILEK